MEVRKRAKEKGIGHNSQHKLDEIARRRPELLSKIANGEFPIFAAFRLCHPTKIRWRTWQATLRLESSDGKGARDLSRRDRQARADQTR